MAVDGPANTQQEARQNWTSAFPLEIANGGNGVGINANALTSTSAALVGTGSALELNNEDGESSAYFAWGPSTVQATTSSYRVGAGISKLITIHKDELPTVTHVAVLMADDTARVMVYRGSGN